MRFAWLLKLASDHLSLAISEFVVFAEKKDSKNDLYFFFSLGQTVFYEKRVMSRNISETTLLITETKTGDHCIGPNSKYPLRPGKTHLRNAQ